VQDRDQRGSAGSYCFFRRRGAGPAPVVACHEMAQEFAQLYRGYSQAYAMGPDKR
jgi:hypothetical protein